MNARTERPAKRTSDPPDAPRPSAGGLVRLQSPTATPEFAAHVAARVARMLLLNGADTQYALSRLHEIGTLLRHPIRALVTPEAIIVAAGTDDGMRTRIGLAIPAMGIDAARQAAVERVVDDLRAGRAAVDELDARLDAADATVGHPGILVVFGVAATAASLARLFGAEWSVVWAAFAAGIVSTILRRAIAEHGFNSFAGAFVTALFSGLVAAFAADLLGGRSAVLSLTAAGMILVPGVPLINGVRDFANGHVGNAVTRLAAGAATVLAIGFALFVAADLAGTALPVGDGPGRVPVWQDLVFSAIAAAGYAMLFNVPLRLVGLCVVCGMAGHGLRTALAVFGVDLVTGSLLGALAAGAVAGLAARRCRVPAVTFAFPGVVAMIPGSYGFRAGIGGLHLMTQGAAASPTLVAETVSLILTTATMTIAIGAGLALAQAAVPERRIAFPPPVNGA